MPADSPSAQLRSFLDQRFDYLVIGAGTAGSVVASRLSEDPHITVGLFEAGPADSSRDHINVPGRYGESLGSSFDYAFRTKAQVCAGNREISVPRGKGLGGTSLLNFMTWMRPNALDIDQWGELGNQGWNWHSLLDYYKKSETLVEPTDTQRAHFRCHVDETQHGRSGPVPAQFVKELCLSGLPFHDTLINLKVETQKSAYAGSNIGVSTSLANVDPQTGYRAHAAYTYLRPHTERSNLHILTNAEVNRVILSDSPVGVKATGVEVLIDGELFIIQAAREIIVCSGAYHSPVLLEKSGIGRPETLKRLGVPVKVANANVGERYQDHSMLSLIYEIDPSISSRDDLSDEVLAAQADEQFKTDQTGPRALLAMTLAYLDMNHFVSPGEMQRVLQQLPKTVSPPSGPFPRYVGDRACGQMEYIPLVGQSSPFFQSEPGKKYLTLLQIQQYPFTTGSVHGKKENGTVVPDIDPRLFQDAAGEADLDLHVLALQHIVDKIEKTEPMASFLRKRVWPPESVRDAEGYRTWVRETATFDWHPVGTCRMGGSGDAESGVVD